MSNHHPYSDSSEPWSNNRNQVYSVEGSRRRYPINLSGTRTVRLDCPPLLRSSVDSPFGDYGRIRARFSSLVSGPSGSKVPGGSEPLNPRILGSRPRAVATEE